MLALAMYVLSWAHLYCWPLWRCSPVTFRRERPPQLIRFRRCVKGERLQDSIATNDALGLSLHKVSRLRSSHLRLVLATTILRRLTRLPAFRRSFPRLHFRRALRRLRLRPGLRLG